MPLTKDEGNIKLTITMPHFCPSYKREITIPGGQTQLTVEMPLSDVHTPQRAYTNIHTSKHCQESDHHLYCLNCAEACNPNVSASVLLHPCCHLAALCVLAAVQTLRMRMWSRSSR